MRTWGWSVNYRKSQIRDTQSLLSCKNHSYKASFAKQMSTLVKSAATLYTPLLFSSFWNPEESIIVIVAKLFVHGVEHPNKPQSYNLYLCHSGTSIAGLAMVCDAIDRQMEGWVTVLYGMALGVYELACSTAVKKTSLSSCGLVKPELSRIIRCDTAGEAFPTDMPLTPSSVCVVVSGLEPYLALAAFPQGSCQTGTLMILGWAWTPWLSKSALVCCT